MSALQQGNFCSFGVINLNRQPVVKIIRQRGVNLARQEVVFYTSFSINVRNGDVFIFVNKARNRIKLLHMEPGGLVIYSKMLEEGRFRLPSRDQEQGSVKMNWLDLVMMVEGVMDDPATRLRRLKRVNI